MNIKELSKVYVEDPKFLYFPPILDYDAVFAAQFLSKEDLESAHTNLSNIIEAMEDGTLENYIIINAFLEGNRKAYLWLSTFYQEVERILEVEDIKNFPPYSTFKNTGVNYIDPFCVKKSVAKSKGYRVEPINIKLRKYDVVNLYRVVYIQRKYEVTDFKDGFPAWYLMQNTTVFENYDVVTNKRVRIDFNKGEFYYFVAGASDNWKQVIEVPIEMDYIVSALLFKN